MVQVCSNNGLRGILKFSEILGSTSYYISKSLNVPGLCSVFDLMMAYCS